MSTARASSIRLLTSASETLAAVRDAQRAGDSIGYVPTMGALHEGHLSLVKTSLAECDRTVVSVYVNPTQFGPGDDLASYPRLLDDDVRLLEELGCWLVFAPNDEQMYPDGFETSIEVGAVAAPWEGAARPTHFSGVATVVLKLFQIVPADRAYFGQKDYQQTLVVQQLVRDLAVPIEIKICPTVREADGLALSSRNRYLSVVEREQAVAIWQSLQLADRQFAAGESDALALRDQMERHLAKFPSLEVEYIALVAAGTVDEVATISGPTVVAIAARIGETRLIDNHTIG